MPDVDACCDAGEVGGGNCPKSDMGLRGALEGDDSLFRSRWDVMVVENVADDADDEGSRSSNVAEEVDACEDRDPLLPPLPLSVWGYKRGSLSDLLRLMV